MIKARPKYPTDLYGTIYIDNIQKAVVICLIIPTIFPFDAISSIKKIPGCKTYVVHPGSSIKRKCCRNDQTNDNSFVNIIDVNSTMQIRRVLWSGWLLKYTRMYDVRCPPCARGIDLASSTIFLLEFGTVLTMRYFYMFPIIPYTMENKHFYQTCMKIYSTCRDLIRGVLSNLFYMDIASNYLCDCV